MAFWDFQSRPFLCASCSVSQVLLAQAKYSHASVVSLDNRLMTIYEVYYYNKIEKISGGERVDLGRR